MKQLLFPGIIASIISFFTSSCSKSVTTTIRDTVTVVNRDTVYLYPKNPIVGLWVGTYFINGAPAYDTFAYYFTIRPDSTMLAIGTGTNGGAGYSQGPWTLNGTTFSATLTSLNGTPSENVQTVTATYDSTNGVLSNGVWTDVSGADVGSGTFALKRVP